MASKSTVPDLGQLAAEELRGLVAELLVQLQALREANATLKDEIARLKGLQGRPKLRPSGMEPATTAAVRGRRGRTRRRIPASPPQRDPGMPRSRCQALPEQLLKGRAA